MKRFHLALTAVLCVGFASAQSFTVYKVNGENIGFNNADVDRIEFTSDILPVPPEMKNFNDYLESLSITEGVVDLSANADGLGIIYAQFKGSVTLNGKCSVPMTLTEGGNVIFSAETKSNKISISRDMFAGTSDVTLNFDINGYTEPGNYALCIPDGFFNIDDTPLGGTTRVFVIQQPMPRQSVNAIPSPGIVTEIGKILFEYDNYVIDRINGTPNAYIYKEGTATPAQTVTFSKYGDKTISIDVSPSITTPGIYKVVIPDGALVLRSENRTCPNAAIEIAYQIEGDEPMPAPKVGDFYYSDGTWSTTLVEKDGVTPIGVVFYTGIAKEYKDNTSYYKQKDGTTPIEEFHGYVIALRDATYFDNAHHACQWSFFDGSDTGCGTSNKTDDFLGYTNTMSIVSRANREKGGLSDSNDNFPAAYYAVDFFEQQCPAPEQSSGWFLPSAQQLKYIYDNVYFEPNGVEGMPYIEKSLKALSDLGGAEMYVRDSQYWTSTEFIDAYGQSYRAYYCCFDESNFSPGFTTWSNKNWTQRVRSILAF